MSGKKLPKLALGAWAWGNDGTFGNNASPTAMADMISMQRNVTTRTRRRFR